MRVPSAKGPSAPGSSRAGSRDQAEDGSGSLSAILEPLPERSPRPEQLAALAGRIQGARQRRAVFLGSEEVGETAWEMLIALFRSEAGVQAMTVTDLCRASHAPSSTALRWLDRLEELGLVCRHPSQSDGRKIFVELEPRARVAICGWLREIWVALYEVEAGSPT